MKISVQLRNKDAKKLPIINKICVTYTLIADIILVYLSYLFELTIALINLLKLRKQHEQEKKENMWRVHGFINKLIN